MRKLSTEALVAILVALLSLILSAYTGYSSNDKDMSNRMTAVETKQKSDREQYAESIQHVEKAVLRVDSKVDRLIEWALGAKK